jgi:hypothetical protein
MTLTANQTAAMTALIKSCLDNMGGSTLADLQADPFTWVDAADLKDAGWGQKEAEGTFGSLVAAGLVWDNNDNDFYIDHDWDVLAKFHA